MKTIIKGNEEEKITAITFVIDWSEPDVQGKINKVLSLCSFNESEVK